jgi:hypothetical protein
MRIRALRSSIVSLLLKHKHRLTMVVEQQSTFKTLNFTLHKAGKQTI